MPELNDGHWGTKHTITHSCIALFTRICLHASCYVSLYLLSALDHLAFYLHLKCGVSKEPVLKDLAESVPRLSSPTSSVTKIDSQSDSHYLEIDFFLLIKDEPSGCVYFLSILRPTTEWKSSELKEAWFAYTSALLWPSVRLNSLLLHCLFHAAFLNLSELFLFCSAPSA